MKKTIHIMLALLSAAMIASLFAGCTVKPADEPTAEVTTEPVVTTVVTTAGPVDDPAPAEDSKWVAAIFGGGPFVSGQGSSTSAVRENMKKSGFNTMIIWSVHVHDNGDLYLNDIAVCKDGKFVMKMRGDTPTWKDIKGEGSSITRIELSIGAWGCADFENIRALMKRDGDGEDTVLYKNFKALIDETKADAINFDDESCYDADALTRFGKMCVKMGCKVTLCPYTNMDMWKQVKKNLGDDCDRIYVQCYDGGAFNDPKNWADAFGMEVIPGYWCLHGGSGDSAETVKNKLTSSKNSITGAFIWYYDDIYKLSGANSIEKYAEAINSLNTSEK